MTMVNQCTLLQTLEHAISQVNNLTDQLDQMTVVLEQQTKIINYINDNMAKMVEALAFICAMKAP
jgi:division protein CdvB (Snf7/Vps24/ESCRT-III family)